MIYRALIDGPAVIDVTASLGRRLIDSKDRETRETRASDVPSQSPTVRGPLP